MAEDEIEQRRKDHLETLKSRFDGEFDERFATEKNREALRKEALADEVSALWNSRQAAARAPAGEKEPLPSGWRNEHWKTRQAYAAKYAGVEVSNGGEADKVLEAYEAELAASAA